MDYLNEQEVVKIEAFCKDEVLFDAVKKVLLKTLYNSGTVEKEKKVDIRNSAFNFIANPANSEASNEKVGENLRALFAGVQEIANGFAELKTIKKKVKVKEEKENKAI